MAENKTQKTKESVSAFLNAIEDKGRRADCKAIHKMMKESTGKTPRMWGASIVGYGDVHYKYASGREGDWFVCGFSPRKTSITMYLSNGLDHYKSSLKKLGKHKTGVGCLYVKKLEDVDAKVLQKIIDDVAKRQKQAK